MYIFSKGLYVDTGSEADAEILNTPFAPNIQNSRIPPLYGVRGGMHPGEMRDSHPVPGEMSLAQTMIGGCVYYLYGYWLGYRLLPLCDW